MAGNRKKTLRIRSRKKRPNKANLKAKQSRIQKNVESLRQLASESGT